MSTLPLQMNTVTQTFVATHNEREIPLAHLQAVKQLPSFVSANANT